MGTIVRLVLSNTFWIKIIMQFKTFVFLFFILSVVSLPVSARPNMPDLNVIKTFAPGRSMMLLNYDGRERTHMGDRKMKASYRMPEKLGNIVDGELVPFA